tara:strand:+ start:211 stop:2121 length:1911 start_codon:yes stop_codon:yes gene_type:complete
MTAQDLNVSMQSCDVLIQNALIFNGEGTPPQSGDLAIKDGKILALGPQLSFDQIGATVDASGLWLMPGLLDIHTHLDLEVELNPGLGEAVRHGTTTVLVGNCSLGTIYGAQNKNGDNPIVDCFTRVENVPKRVLQRCADAMYWDNSEDYLRHFEDIALGPNIAAFVPHSMLRIQVMGVHDSVTRKPTDAETAEMERLLREAMVQGYLGLSTDQIVFHYLSNDPHKDCRIPAHFAEDEELKPALDIVREYGRVWQTNPDGERMGRTIKRFFWSAGWFFRKPLRISALTAIDFNNTPGIWKLMLTLAGVINSWACRGKMHFQALGANFRMWSDGIVAPIFEELESTRELIACEPDDVLGRRALLDNADWQARFRLDWARVEKVKESTTSSKSATMADRATFQMDMDEMFFDDTPIAAWNGQPMQRVFDRLQVFQQTDGEQGALSTLEAEAFAQFPANTTTTTEFFLQGIRLYDTKFRWWFDSANMNEDIVEQILFHKHALPGFNDSGAHLTNLAFYDCNLNTLRLAQRSGVNRVAAAVKRLTTEPAEFFGLDTGTLTLGAQADIVLINPDHLATHDINAQRKKIWNEKFQNEVMVNRSDGVVVQVYIAGQCAWKNGDTYGEALGRQRLGRALRVQRHA